MLTFLWLPSWYKLCIEEIMIVRLVASKDLIKIGKLIDAETKFGLLQNLGNSATFPALNNKKC